MKRFLGLIVGLLFIGGLTAAGAAPGPPGDGSHPRDNRDRACENTEGDEDRPPFCDDEGDPGDDPDPPEAADCPPGDGPLSGVVQQVSDGLADGGAPAELTEVVDTVNCELVVTIEEALGLSGGEDPGEPDPADCPPGEGPVSGGLQQVSDGLADGGAPAELTDGVDTLNCEVIVAIEEGAGLTGDDEEDPGDDPDPVDCPPADGPLSGGLQQVSDGLADGGAPAELTDGVDTLNCEVIVAIEEGAGLTGDDEEDPGDDPDPVDCPPADGPLSGGLQQVSDGLADGGAPAELTDGVDTLNCEVIVAIEEGAGL